MLFKNVNYIIGGKISPIKLEILNPISIEFLIEISNELRKNKKVLFSADLFFLMIWASKKNLYNYLKKYRNISYRVGRGLAFHICPSNVPLNFFYSFAFSLLSGNSNIIKIPSENFNETDILLKIIKNIINKKKYKKIKASNIFIKYDKEKKINDYYSSLCDVRVVWGGDNTIKELRKSPLKVKAIEYCFPDKYSLSVMNIDKMKKLKGNELNKIINGFFYDAYTMKQQACNSPHFIFWVGKRDIKFTDNFWINLSNIVKKKNNFKLIDISDKYNYICDNFINLDTLYNFKNFENYVYVSEYSKSKIENIRGINGIFYQRYCPQLKNLKKSITDKCQTISYYGFNKNDFKKLIEEIENNGVDRIVPIGKSMSINFTWDGFDMIKSLSRIIDIQ